MPANQETPVVRLRQRPARPVTLRFQTVHGYRRAYRMGGKGPALLFIHGIGDSSETWQDILPLLTRDHTVIAPDLLGHGASDKPRADYSVAAYACGIRDLLAVLDIDRVTLIGHSLGGGVAAQFAYQFPERCERLVLVSTAGAGREVSPLLRLVSGPGADIVLPMLTPLAELPPVAWSLRTAATVLRRLGSPLGDGIDDLLVGYRRLRDPHARSAFLRTLRAAVDPRGQVVSMLDRCYLAEGVPTQLICGDRDPVIPFSHSEVAHAALPGSRLTVFQGADHFPHRHDPGRFVAVLRKFLAETEPHKHDADAWRELLREGRPSLSASAAAGVPADELSRAVKLSGV
jgi:pimeloyl-ACP methyl ester carboxylesterase